MRKMSILVSLLAFCLAGSAQENTNKNKFRQLKQEFATPNVYRTASGAPGHEYWQQKADYKIQVSVDDEKQQIHGYETVTYHNQSPDPLDYLWVQLDQNVRAQDSNTPLVRSSRLDSKTDLWTLERISGTDFDGGFKIQEVTDAKGASLPYVINKTMMRIDLPTPLKPGSSVSFSVKWWYNVNERAKIGGRSGFEYFEKDDNYLYTIAQFYPRMAVYNEVEGWQNKQFLGDGEFTLPFGDFEVSITVPADHVVGATGVLQNKSAVLTSEQMNRLKKAETASEPVIVITQEEAEKAEKSRATKTKTWVYKADNVRDFAFVSSRKFIWDAMGVKFGDRTVLAMSYYPKEGNPLWEQYSTKAVAHTLRVYSKHTFDYPYPVAISVHTKNIGMEYPMICFNRGRPEEDGTYSESTKYGMISVIIHEVGHNFFPMIVNSDERQWTWMDEGLNSFLEYLAEKEWDVDFPTRSRGGDPYSIVDYMKMDKKFLTPIMTNSESLWNFGPNAYHKPTVALNILRETVMGRELFDYAFKEYAKRWMFKHPSPEDFFRTMEDASAVDLDWFWRGWFYTTDNVDIAIDKVSWYQASTTNPEVEKPLARERDGESHRSMTHIRNEDNRANTVVELDPATKDFYNSYDPYAVTAEDRAKYDEGLEGYNEEELAYLNNGHNFYQLDFKNIGGLVMPLILQFEFTDGSSQEIRIPAEIWRMDNSAVSKVFEFEKEVARITLDPYQETADVDMNNNYWPPCIQPTRFELFKEKDQDKKEPNPMQKAAKNNKQPKDDMARKAGE
ncbi:M1 family metallopeptidase [Mangrovibacterium diazotrophicum]|uniref:Peptidase M1-like protein n=1 Tax=Mangrovibacterium diazotrophicum TaxID=1261403 RepID=A0A419VX37_9BACT|nr:M1 family metallopeptidase [Mangrovibacterium diazotrophicum]RKD87778.1 peptidase M1-like protein [Mangrovibacterium diazotrophicum]